MLHATLARLNFTVAGARTVGAPAPPSSCQPLIAHANSAGRGGADSLPLPPTDAQATLAGASACYGLVEKFEVDAYPTSLRFDWIVKARLDGAWAQPMPSAYTFDDDAVALPTSGFGFNADVAIVPHELAPSYFGAVRTVDSWCEGLTMAMDGQGQEVADLEGTLAELRSKVSGGWR